MFKKKPLNITMSDFQKLQERLTNLEKETQENNKVLNDRIDLLERDVENLKQQIHLNKEQVDEYIKNQEEIIMDMINKFNDQFLNYKSKFLADIDNLKSQQDILKISYSINEKRLLDKVDDHIKTEIEKYVKGKEKEVLISIWIQELKQIISNFFNISKLLIICFNS
jgi:hypothetical protein